MMQLKILMFVVFTCKINIKCTKTIYTKYSQQAKWCKINGNTGCITKRYIACSTIEIHSFCN